MVEWVHKIVKRDIFQERFSGTYDIYSWSTGERIVVPVSVLNNEAKEDVYLSANLLKCYERRRPITGCMAMDQSGVALRDYNWPTPGTGQQATVCLLSLLCMLSKYLMCRLCALGAC
ncbi:hypothetical protein PSACC_03660 [Paramicrosporidium saccamoebae]|uniref:Uncharacterized protein n=1 Tax=Paramicrosporidium saccamoebae TaxID=1246581 RepID=A0A2H9TFE3_9FUNG|nr:hypothetical protein PSACC_03660 [Paramicrosporidium saccamoebae]